VVGHRIRPWLTVVGAGLVLGPVVQLGWWGFPVFVGLYCSVLLAVGVVRKEELRPLWDGLRGGSSSPADSVTR